MERVCGNYYVASSKVKQAAMKQGARSMTGRDSDDTSLQKLMGKKGNTNLADTSNSDAHPLPSALPFMNRSVRFEELRSAWAFVRSGS